MVIESCGDARKVLVFGRRRQYKRLVEMASQLFPNAELHVWSDERLGRKGVRWWGEQFYSNFIDMGNASCESGLDEILKYNLQDVPVRCRLLREMPRNVADKMIVSAFRAWSNVLQSYGYDAVLSQGIDSYVIDLLERVSRLFSVPFISAVTTPFSGRIRFTRRGELWGEKKASPGDRASLEESVDNLMRVDYRADILIGANSRPYATVLRRLLIDSFKPMAFLFYRIFFNDPLSFSFPSRSVYRGRMFADFSRAVSALRMESVGSDFPENYVFMPLQFYPESTTDYWVPELEMTNHQEVVLKIVGALGELGLPVIVKEHPAAVGRRQSDFIAALSSCPHVYFAPLLHPVGELVQRAALVIGAGTTTMLQALLMQRPALFCGTPFYGTGGAPVLASVARVEEIKEVVRKTMDGYSTLGVDGHSVVESYFLSSASGSLGSYSLIGESSVAAPSGVNVSSDLLAILDGAICAELY